MDFTAQGSRYPLNDANEEAARTEGYWRWLDGAELGADMPEVADTTPDGGRWVKLNTWVDADYEARHMRHSIGHSWDYYAKTGNIFSLRDSQNRPLATVLVIFDANRNHVAIHAREHENARLSPANLLALRRFGARANFDVSSDAGPFDAFLVQDAPNTRFKYLLRGDGPEKTFGSVVLADRFTPDDAVALAGGLRNGKFDPDALGFPRFGGAGCDHEVLSMRHVVEQPDGPSFAEFATTWKNAAEAGWESASPTP